MVSAHAQMRVYAHDAVGGRELAGDELQQRRLAGAVRPDQSDARVEIDAELQVLVDVRLLRVKHACTNMYIVLAFGCASVHMYVATVIRVPMYRYT